MLGLFFMPALAEVCFYEVRTAGMCSRKEYKDTEASWEGTNVAKQGKIRCNIEFGIGRHRAVTFGQSTQHSGHDELHVNRPVSVGAGKAGRVIGRGRRSIFWT